MITQYTRLITNNATGEVVACTSQDFPFVDGWEPIELDSEHTAHDCEIAVNLPFKNYKMGVNQPMLRARQLIDNLEVVNGNPQVKTGKNADTDVTTKITTIVVKPITESSVRVELLVSLADKGQGDLSGTSTLQLLRLDRPQVK